MNKKLTIITTFLFLAIGYVSYEGYLLDKKLYEYSQNQKNSIITSLPDISFKYFGENTDDFDLLKSAGNGNYLFVHFWGTWCGPCETEFPDLIALTEMMKNKKNVKFLFIAVNYQVKNVKKFLKKFKETNNFILLEDNDSKFQKSFGTFKLPESFLFSPSKKLLKKFVGPQKWTEKKFKKYFNSL